MKNGTATLAAKKVLTAFRRLPNRQRDEVLTELVRNRVVREDLMDIAVAEVRRKEPGRPLREFLTEHASKSR